jgi:hypothetical protein
MKRAIIAAVLLAGTLRAQSGQPFQPGQRIPDFELRDQAGAPRRFSDLRGPRGLMMVFYRSADW